ncbi:MAG: hypothetical protein R3310_11980 [Candidatus Competibacteraceae bacterium]|nr:hypothetical protein [Candidatus Competibacteraceae bacterium]
MSTDSSPQIRRSPTTRRRSELTEPDNEVPPSSFRLFSIARIRLFLKRMLALPLALLLLSLGFILVLKGGGASRQTLHTHTTLTHLKTYSQAWLREVLRNPQGRRFAR